MNYKSQQKGVSTDLASIKVGIHRTLGPLSDRDVQTVVTRKWAINFPTFPRTRCWQLQLWCQQRVRSRIFQPFSWLLSVAGAIDLNIDLPVLAGASVLYMDNEAVIVKYDMAASTLDVTYSVLFTAHQKLATWTGYFHKRYVSPSQLQFISKWWKITSDSANVTVAALVKVKDILARNLATSYPSGMRNIKRKIEQHFSLTMNWREMPSHAMLLLMIWW